MATAMGRAKKLSDCDKIIAFLTVHEWISPAIAVREFNCYRFGGRIYDLKKRGYLFDERMIYTRDEDGNPTHWKEFKLVKGVA